MRVLRSEPAPHLVTGLVEHEKTIGRIQRVLFGLGASGNYEVRAADAPGRVTDCRGFAHAAAAKSPAQQRAQRHTFGIANFRGNLIDTALAGLEQVQHGALDAQSLEVSSGNSPNTPASSCARWWQYEQARLGYVRSKATLPRYDPTVSGHGRRMVGRKARHG
jgi:hypothetical protein